jgi:hypothetical protein
MYKLLCTLGLAILLTIGSYAQKQARPSSTANSNLQAQLQNTVDAKNARVGDEVILKTTQSATLDGLAIPKGSRLIGRVTDVQQKAKNGAASRVGLLFDQIENRGQTTPITATIVSIVNTNTAAAIDEPIDMGMSSSTSSRTSTSSSGGSGGGLLGGVTNTVGSVVNSTTQTVGGVTNSAVQTVGGTTQTLGRTVNGLQISTSASGSAQSSTTLSSPNNNVRLEKGVTFGLNVQKSPENE